ncbi:MAG: cysteine desulfurase family protein [Clostridia bacterium]|nr:cysteine desulfurase family protein [Clostridia bacterium]
MIYFDNAATTKMYAECEEVLRHFCTEEYFNPSALYANSTKVTNEINRVREELLNTLHAPQGELIFTGSGTEADNMVMFGTKKWKNARIIVSEGEHDAIYNSALELKQQGYDVQFVSITKSGAVDIESLKSLLNENVALVSIMHISNETGAINDLQKISKLIRANSPKAIIHSDGVQAFGKIDINLRALGVDLYTISGHKIHAPKGVGALFIKKGVFVRPLIFGGGQEKGYRSSTENVAGICAFGVANAMGQSKFATNYSTKREIVEYLVAKLRENIPSAQIITPLENCAPNILTVAFENIRGEVLLHILEKDNILVGIGSACSSHKESRFKKLLALDDRHRDGIVRFSFSQFNTIEEVDIVVEKIVSALNEFGNFVRV